MLLIGWTSTTPVVKSLIILPSLTPVGLALADDIVFRLFHLHVFGVREDLAGNRRGRPRERLQETIWNNSAAATSRLGIAGPPLGGHGPLESSGRFQLHGHWRWWFRSLTYQRLVELCKQQPDVLEDRLREATTEAIRSIMSIQGTSVAQVSRSFDAAAAPLEPLPFLDWQNIDFGGDGGSKRRRRERFRRSNDRSWIRCSDTRPRCPSLTVSEYILINSA